LLANGITAKLLNVKSGTTYLNFLRKVNSVAGLFIIVFYVINFGKLVIDFLKERVRLDLLYDIKKKMNKLQNKFLKEFSINYFLKYSIIRYWGRKILIRNNFAEYILRYEIKYFLKKIERGISVDYKI
jgi:hypothetical protein